MRGKSPLTAASTTPKVYTKSEIIASMKELRFRGSSRADLRDFPKLVRGHAGLQLRKVQRGVRPPDSKAMPSIGPGVVEIRLWDEAGTFRVIYVANLGDAVYVLHCFQKKTQKTRTQDIDLAKKRFQDLKKEISS